jgi:hypothetical protein
MANINDKNVILESITKFLISNSDNNIPTIELYNKWSNWSKIIIDDDEIMEECLRYLGKSKKINNNFVSESM